MWLGKKLQTHLDKWRKCIFGDPLQWRLHLICIHPPHPPVGLSQRPMKVNVGVSARQCRPESIYLHTSTGLVEDRLWASHILVSLKTRLRQTWVNGPLIDTQRQVLFLLELCTKKKERRKKKKAKGDSFTQSCRADKALQGLEGEHQVTNQRKTFPLFRDLNEIKLSV